MLCWNTKIQRGVGVAVTLETRILEMLGLYLSQDTGHLRIVVFLSPCGQVRGYYIDLVKTDSLLPNSLQSNYHEKLYSLDKQQ